MTHSHLRRREEARGLRRWIAVKEKDMGNAYMRSKIREEV